MMEVETAVHASMEATLHLWRTAAHAIETDPNVDRRQAYEAAIGHVIALLMPYTSMHALAAQSWSIELWALAAVFGLRQSGRVLNYQVVAAAACWQRMGQLMDAASTL